jgi:4-hydroxy-3-polyprenylbenzoate decarboxylase
VAGADAAAGMSGTTPASVFVGVSGASGAPYAMRLVQALDAADCSLHVCISDSGVLVLDHELELGAGGRDAVTGAFLERAGVTAKVYAPDDLAAPASSGSSAPDAVIICPCSVAAAAHIALGTTRTLIHRAADVALKERRPLVVVPRETPLTQIHLRRLLELAEAGAVVLPAMPAFYSRPQSLRDAVDHVVGKIMAALGFEQKLFAPWDGGAG